MQKRKISSYEQYKEENRAMRSEQIVAEQIQRSMLPTAYPAFKEHAHIDLYADMDAACEVGGDFYDYFSVDSDHICFGISDVMGKGIPAAMHMAITKTMIKMRLMSGDRLSSVFSEVNRLLSVSTMNRENSTFVTSWTAVMDVKTNILTCVNAGHNPPVLKRKGEPSQLLKTKPDFPLAAYYSKKHPGIYREFELKMEKGDILLLYTDGVTESQNEKKLMISFSATAVCLNL
ncbi:MAG: SpoIIE family protein phosphatase [Clostridiales bacterium]|nr:SpoIIE family protein phosphatase [Clostridiales bacterium]